MIKQSNVGPTKTAVISDCGKYRYELTRRWGSGEAVCFIGLNPSTADANIDDPTIRRCVNYAKSWGYSELIMVNVFAWRATDPKDMLEAGKDAVGPDNIQYIDRAIRRSSMAVAAWGNNCPVLHSELYMLAEYGPRLHALKLNKSGSPAHPLYQKKDIKPQPLLTLMANLKAA